MFILKYCFNGKKYVKKTDSFSMLLLYLSVCFYNCVEYKVFLSDVVSNIDITFAINHLFSEGGLLWLNLL